MKMNSFPIQITIGKILPEESCYLWINDKSIVYTLINFGFVYSIPLLISVNELKKFYPTQVH